VKRNHAKDLQYVLVCELQNSSCSLWITDPDRHARQSTAPSRNLCLLCVPLLTEMNATTLRSLYGRKKPMRWGSVSKDVGKGKKKRLVHVLDLKLGSDMDSYTRSYFSTDAFFFILIIFLKATHQLVAVFKAPHYDQANCGLTVNF
jgi:hypothetical protein